MAVSPLETVPMPPRIAALLQDHRGYPVPFFEMGEPIDLSWWTRGALATAREAADAMQAGAAKLWRVAAEHDGEAGVVHLTKQLVAARRLLPDPSLLREVEA